jgi:hypothetical protein
VGCANHPEKLNCAGRTQPDPVECLLRAPLATGNRLVKTLWMLWLYRLYSKSSLTPKEWRFNLSFPWVSMLFLNSWRVSSHTVRYDTNAPAIQKQHWHSREAQIEPPLFEREWAFRIQCINGLLVIPNTGPRTRTDRAIHPVVTYLSFGHYDFHSKLSSGQCSSWTVE